MGFMGFVTWFAIGLIGSAMLQIMFDNVFIVSLIVGLGLGVLGARE